MNPITTARAAPPITDAERQWLKALAHVEHREVVGVTGTTEGVLVSMRVRIEVWRHTSANYGVMKFDVRSLKDGVANDWLDYQMIEMNIGQDYYEHVRDNNGIEPEKLAHMPPELLAMPGMAAILPNGSLQMIDGSHRLVKNVQAGNTYMRIIVLGGPVWARHLIDQDDTDGNEAMRRLFEVG